MFSGLKEAYVTLRAFKYVCANPLLHYGVIEKTVWKFLTRSPTLCLD